MERFPKGMIFSGAVLMGMTVALGWGGLNIIIRGEIAKQMRLINGTDTYKAWHMVQLPVLMSIYLFNLTNPDEVANGGKPVLKETGPYVYRERMFKDADEDNVINETLRYRQIRSYYFQPDLSTGSEDDMIVLINEPLVMTAKMLKEIEDDSVGPKAAEWLKERGEMVTMSRPVKDWLFGGYSIQNYVDLVNETLVTSVGQLQLPSTFDDGMFSAIDLLRKNNSDGQDGEWLIMTGRNVSEHFGKVVGWNGNDALTFYKDDTCNALNGTDGSIFHPFLLESTPMYMYGAEMCRSVTLLRGEKLVTKGIESYRYFMDPNTFMSPEKNPDNWCFCSPNEKIRCEQVNGVHTLEPCLDGFPRSVSHPHFWGADDATMTAVDGMMPNKEKHETFLDIHTLSGIVLTSSKRFQYNLELMPYSNMPTLAKLPKVTMPIFWMDETMDAHHSDVLMLNIIKAIEEMWANIRWGLLGISGLLVFIGVATALTRRSSIKVERVTLIQ